MRVKLVCEGSWGFPHCKSTFDSCMAEPLVKTLVKRL